MTELGNTLSRARRARGITLEDAERDTHVSKRYLQALESEEFAAFPAPVYARGFLRTYSRYLGLNPEELIRVFPNGDLTVDMTPLPTVTRPSNPVNVNWVVAGIVMLFLLGAGLLLMRSGRDNASVADAPRANATVVSAVLGTTNAAAPAAQPQAPLAQPAKAIAPVKPGQLPDFVGADMASALTVLRDNQMSYVVIEMPSKSTAKGLIISQSPSAGAKSNVETAVTLYVSGGTQAQ